MVFTPGAPVSPTIIKHGGRPLLATADSEFPHRDDNRSLSLCCVVGQSTCYS